MLKIPIAYCCEHIVVWLFQRERNSSRETGFKSELPDQSVALISSHAPSSTLTVLYFVYVEEKLVKALLNLLLIKSRIFMLVTHIGTRLMEHLGFRACILTTTSSN